MKKVLACTYRSQRDNADLPGASCNTTAMVMVLEASGHPPPEIVGLPNSKQPEDFLTELGDSPGAYAKMYLLCPWFFGEVNKGLPPVTVGDVMHYPIVRPPEAPMMLDWIVAQAYGKALTRYSEKLDFGAIIDEIDRGRAVLVHGLFTPQGHFVAVVGYETVDDVAGKAGALTAFVVDDPWGNWLTDYEDQDGEGVEIPADAALKVLRPGGVATKSGNAVIA